MTIDKREMITIPKWLVIVLVPLILGGIGGFASSMYTMGGYTKQVEINQKAIEKIETIKADKEVTNTILNNIYSSLHTIEKKLDDHVKDK